MLYTLPLKQKQIEQSRLEAEARKQTTIEDAEAAAQAKVIDSKAEQQRQNLLADSEANHIRVSAQADQDRQKLMADSEANPAQMDSHADRPEVISALHGSVGISERESRTLHVPFLYTAAPFSPICCWLTRSTGCHREPRRHCWKR